MNSSEIAILRSSFFSNCLYCFRNPGKLKSIKPKYTFLSEGVILDEEFITSLPSQQQEIANQINRRTEFKVLKTTFQAY